MDEKKPIPEWHIELHGIICKYLYDAKATGPDVLAFLSLSLVGTIENNHLDEDFLKFMFDQMLEDFREKRKAREERENGMDQT